MLTMGRLNEWNLLYAKSIKNVTRCTLDQQKAGKQGRDERTWGLKRGRVLLEGSALARDSSSP